MIFNTNRLILRPWKETDAEDLYKYAKEIKVAEPTGFLPHTSVENSLEIIKSALMVDETYAVCLKEDNKAIGSIGIKTGKSSNIKIPDNQGEIGYWLGVPFWGRGIIPEAVRELIRHGFDDLKLEKLWCCYFDGNEKSKRVQEKCGFVYHHINENILCKPTNDIRTEHITCLEKQYARPLFSDEISAATDISWEVFSQYEAPVYSDEGVQTFRASLDDKQRISSMKWYGAFDGGKMVGVISVRSPQHISGFFVKSEYQKQGFGRRLFERMKADYSIKNFTVNSSPYAVPIYEKLGFTAVDTEQVVDGLRFTPMKYIME